MRPPHPQNSSSPLIARAAVAVPPPWGFQRVHPLLAVSLMFVRLQLLLSPLWVSLLLLGLNLAVSPGLVLGGLQARAASISLFFPGNPHLSPSG